LTNYAKIKRWMLKEGLSVIDLNWKTLGKVGINPVRLFKWERSMERRGKRFNRDPQELLQNLSHSN